MKYIIFILFLFILCGQCSAIEINEGVSFQTEDSQCDYYISSTFNADNIIVYTTALNINGDNITTYPASGWINMSMENLGNTTYINFSNNATASNITVINGFADFLIKRGNIYTLYYQSNDTVYQSNTSSDVTDTEIIFTSIPSGSWYITWSSYAPPILYTPTNESIIHSTYPPLTYDITLDWQYTSAPQYRVVTSTNEHFTLIYSDTYVSTSESLQSFIVGERYWWRVYSYDGTTFSNSSDIWNFNLTGNSSLTGSAIEGVVYADIDGAYTALSSAEITIWNNTWSDSAITGSNGYYVFEGLNNDTVYSLQAKKDLYLDSSISLINATDTPTTNNFYLLPDRTSEEWRHDVKFIVQTLYGTKYPGVAVNVYEGSSVTALFTGTTESDGSITFRMSETQEYRLTFINATQGINKEITLYPKEDRYYIIITSISSWDDWSTPINEAITVSVTKELINATHAYINITYTDTLTETTGLLMYINQSNTSDVLNQTVIASWNGGATSSVTHSFIIVNYAGEHYYAHVVATHTTYETIDKTYGVEFSEAVTFPGIPDKVWLYLAVIFLVFSAALFTKSSSEQGAFIVCCEGWLFLAFGWFDSVNTVAVGGGLAIATVLSVIAVINAKNKAEGI